MTGWRLIGVDTHDTDAKIGWDGDMEQLRGWNGGSGRLLQTQLEWLETELTSHASQPTILFMHHPPTPVGSRWLDDSSTAFVEHPG